MGQRIDFENSSEFYLDGSGGAQSKDPRLRRCGWSAVTMNYEFGTPTAEAAVYGGLPGAWQTVPRAELHAAISAMELAKLDEKWEKVSSITFFKIKQMGKLSENAFSLGSFLKLTSIFHESADFIFRESFLPFFP